MTYVGSRFAEIEAMLREVPSGLGEGGSNLAAPPAKTLGPVAVDAHYVTAGDLAVGGSPLRLDVDAVEHLRQNRLRRWQKPADPINRKEHTA